MNREIFGNGNIYHVYNRGSDKRTIFLDMADHIRFQAGLREYNDANPSRDSRALVVMPQVKIVDILCYCLMPNHFHLMLRQVRDGGITQFMRKLGTGYTMYFNKKYERSGVLFQGIFKSVLVDRDPYLRYLPHYIHLNPTELGVDAGHLGEYRWSSYADFIGGGSLITDTAYLKELYAPMRYQDALTEWVNDKGKHDLSPVSLDS